MMQQAGWSELQTCPGMSASAAETQVLPYTAPKVERMAAVGTSKLGEYFNGPACVVEGSGCSRGFRKSSRRF